MSGNTLLAKVVFAHLPPWMADRRVKCKGITEKMYPNQPSSEVANAKALCNGYTYKDENGKEYVEPACPMRMTCLKHAIDQREPYGVWGGTSERDRRKIQRARNQHKNPHIYSLEDVRFPHIVLVRKKQEDVRFGSVVLIKRRVVMGEKISA